MLLLRESKNGLEVFIQHRVNTMDFAAGMVVYPGGRVDTQDADVAGSGKFDDRTLTAHAQRWADTAVWEQGAAQAPFKAGELLAAAVREVFEETGLLLDPDQLLPWANWVTPVGPPRRFDTYFYVAAVRADQEPQHQTTEAFVSTWITPEDLFAALERQELKMMRPTQRTLSDAMELGSLQNITASTHRIRAVHPDVRSATTNLPVSEAEHKPQRH